MWFFYVSLIKRYTLLALLFLALSFVPGYIKLCGPLIILHFDDKLVPIETTFYFKGDDRKRVDLNVKTLTFIFTLKKKFHFENHEL